MSRNGRSYSTNDRDSLEADFEFINASRNVLRRSTLPLNVSSSEESDLSGLEDVALEIPECPVPHNVGREVVNSIVPANVDTIFAMLFTNSKFLSGLHAVRKTFNIVHTDWQTNGDSQKFRKVTFTVTLTNAIGPKVSHVTENQVLLPVSKPGAMYAVDVEVLNGGIPFADSFYVTTHYCLSRLSTNQTNLRIVNQIKFKKSVWGAKGMIESNTWAGVQDYYTHLERALQEECGKLSLGSETPPSTPDIPTKARPPLQRTKSRTKRIAPSPPGVSRIASQPLSTAQLPHGNISPANVSIANSLEAPGGSSLLLKLIVAILACLGVLNGFLYVQLARFETEKSNLILPSQPINVQYDTQKYAALFQQQEDLHRLELQKWQEILIAALKVLHKADEDLESLKSNVASYGSNRLTTNNHPQGLVEETTPSRVKEMGPSINPDVDGSKANKSHEKSNQSLNYKSSAVVEH